MRFLDNERTRKMLLMCSVATVLYGCFNYLSGRIHPPGCSFVELRPQVALLMVVGIVHGPVAGFVAGCLGDRLGYALQGLGLLHAWNWSVGNGFIGMIPGLFRLTGVRHVASGRDFQRVLLAVFLASSLPIVFAASLDTILSGISFMDSTYTLILPAFITDAMFGVILVPALLLLLRRMTVTIDLRIMLMTTYPLVFAVLLTYAASNWSTLDDPINDTRLIRDFYNLGILTLCVLVLGLGVSTFLARKITRPVVSLAGAAASIAGGDYSPSRELDETASRVDELGRLASVFDRMRQEVHSREQRLEQEVRELKIEIDKSRQQVEVKKIVGTDYFKTLRDKASKLRIQE